MSTLVLAGPGEQGLALREGTMWLSRQSRELLEFLTRQSAHACFASDSKGDILWANSAFSDRLKYTVMEVVDRNCLQLTSRAEDVGAQETMTAQLIQGHVPQYRMRIELEDKDGIPHPVLIQVRRWPVDDIVDFFITDVVFVDESTSVTAKLDDLMSDVQGLQTLLYTRKAEADSLWGDLKSGISWSFSKHPRYAWGVVFLSMLFLFAWAFGVGDATRLFKTFWD